jgi:hypothetical protein
MHDKILFRFCYGLTIAVLTTGFSGSASLANTPFEMDWIRGWQQSKQQTNGEFSIALEYDAPPKDRYHVKLSGSQFSLVESIEEESPNTRSIFCFNDRYSFSISKKLNANEWMLASVAPTHAEGSAIGIREVMMPALEAVRAGWRLGGLELESLVEQPGMKVTRIEGKPSFQFEYTPTDKESFEMKGFPLLKGTVILSKENDWNIERADFVGRFGKFQGRCEVRYQRDEASNALLVKSVTWSRPQTAIKPSTYIVSKKISAELTRSDFLLSAYGLPEPDIGPKPNPYRIWFIAIAMFCLTFVLGRMAYRNYFGIRS